jgi:hypothetical protein
METLLPTFQTLCEKQVKKHPHKIIAGIDETFFGEFIILVLMDLRSGYLLLEDVSDDRCFDTWYEKTTPRLEQLGIEVDHVVSDRAKALIKMAVTGFKCESGGDVFHAQQDASRWLGAKVGKHHASAEKEIESTQKAEQKPSKKQTGFQKFVLKERRINAENVLAQAKKTKQEYHDNLQGIGDEVHPFSLTDNTIKSAKEVEEGLENRVQALEKIEKERGFKNNTKVPKKLRNQFESLSVSVSFWWAMVLSTLQDLTSTDDIELKKWLLNTLLPVVYWHYKYKQTKSSTIKEKYYNAWVLASAQFKSHPFTLQLSEKVLFEWLIWAENIVPQFQRSSSAVEGRNGCLSQMVHNRRGLTEKRLKALTVIHNYGIKRHDNSTAAMRLFNREFPDLFSWVLDEMGELPLPRKSRQRKIANPLKLIGVPS